jgi:hypothetical protein
VQHDPRPHADQGQSAKKASLAQVAATLFWGLCMIGKKGTWERDGVTITIKQAVIGALVAGCVVVALLLLVVHFALRKY